MPFLLLQLFALLLIHFPMISLGMWHLSNSDSESNVVPAPPILAILTASLICLDSAVLSRVCGSMLSQNMRLLTPIPEVSSVFTAFRTNLYTPILYSLRLPLACCTLIACVAHVLVDNRQFSEM